MSNESDFAVLLENINTVEVDMARVLLSAAGIPSTTAGPDFDMAELGRAAHDMLRGTSLLVPGAALEQARKVLEDAGWNQERDVAPPEG